MEYFFPGAAKEAAGLGGGTRFVSSLVLNVLHRAEAAVVSPLGGDVSPADRAVVVAPPSGSERTGSLPSVDLVSRGVKSIHIVYLNTSMDT